MMKIAADYQKDPFTGKILYPGEMYEEAETTQTTEEQKEAEKPKRGKKNEND